MISVAILTLVASAVSAAEYVDDHVCATCHAAKIASYQGVGMAQSMRRPRQEVLIEDFRNAHFFHQPSQSHYEMAWKDGKLTFRRYQVDDAGRRRPPGSVERSVSRPSRPSRSDSVTAGGRSARCGSPR